jgi:hypothetical protein
MRTIGLLCSAAETPAVLAVGGISVLERQMRQLRRAGLETIIACDIEPLTPLPAGVEPVPVRAIAGLIAAADLVLTIAPGLVIDDRAIDAVLAAGGAALLVAADGAAPGVPGVGVERIDAATLAAGIMALPGALVQRVAATLGDWNLPSTLLRAAAADPAVQRVDIASIALYMPARRRIVPLLWARPADADAAVAATEMLIAAAQHRCLDWPARYLHTRLENWLVRRLASTGVTSEMVWLARLLPGIAAGIGFAGGWLWAGLALALLTAPLDSVGRKLADVRIEFSKSDALQPLLGMLLEYGWYLCAAAHFAGAMGQLLPWAIAALIILPALSTTVQGEFFRRMRGRTLDDAGPVDRRIRLFAASRNTFLWAWLPLAALGLWFEGFVALAAYSVLTAGVVQWRFYIHVARHWAANGSRSQRR